MPVSFAELLKGYEVLSMASGDSHAYLCRQTGKVYTRLDPLYVGEEYAGDLPDDVDDEEKYLALPDKQELDLGVPLVMDFVRQVLPDEADKVRDMFRRKGAYQRLKTPMIRRGVREQLYEFERRATEQALREWCELNSIELSD